MESGRIADQLRRSVHGEAWHGPSVMEVLKGVSWEKAAARPVAGAHTIWEIALHISAWAEVGRLRASGTAVEVAPERDWPGVGEASEDEWRRVVDALEQ